MRTVTDDKGIKHTHVHGVPVEEWFRTINEAQKELLFSRYLQRIILDDIQPCADPDCGRLHRLHPRTARFQAMYQLTADVEPVRPAAPDDRDRAICEGHPFKAGSYLCSSCARVATAKRIINRNRGVDP